MGDVATLITAIGGASAAILGSIAGLIVALRRISPKERGDAAANAAAAHDGAQDERLRELADEIERLRELTATDEGA